MENKSGHKKYYTSIIVTAIIISYMLQTAAAFGRLNRKLSISYNTIGAADLDDSGKYVVIFDAGSTESRLHVFRFSTDAAQLDLLPIGTQFEFYDKTKPGLSSFANNPEEAADSLKQLLQEADALVPKDVQPQTPVRLGATGGLRLLSFDTAEKILESVKELLKESNFNYKPEWVSVIEGFQEGSYMWVAVNFLLENLGKSYTESVGVIDLGGASVQMAYAISKENAENAPKSLREDDKYLSEWNLKGTKYYLYSHSYLSYGVNAARAQVLRLSGNDGNPCAYNGYQGTYEYSGETYKVSPPPSGNDIEECRSLFKLALNLGDYSYCPHQNCTFDGVWNGGGGDGQKKLYLGSSLYFTPNNAKIFDSSSKSAQVRPIDYLEAAKIACKVNAEDIKAEYPLLREEDEAFLCFDLVYEYTLLVDGFGIEENREVTVVNKMEFKGSEFDAAWPLGCAIDVLSPPQFKLALFPTTTSSSVESF